MSIKRDHVIAEMSKCIVTACEILYVCVCVYVCVCQCVCLCGFEEMFETHKLHNNDADV